MNETLFIHRPAHNLWQRRDKSATVARLVTVTLINTKERYATLPTEPRNYTAS